MSVANTNLIDMSHVWFEKLFNSTNELHLELICYSRVLQHQVRGFASELIFLYFLTVAGN